ncbi:MAG: hypothetical protein EOP89_17175 [Lysobacteraceae bacterium]|nr:MAG: hypothetical protein EOP89_17175 [Xanthomonadaceae bacterium]
MKRTRQGHVALGLALALAGTVTLAPEVLAFPHQQRIGDTIVYSDMPLPATMPQVLARSDGLLRHSAIYGPGYGRRIFLTDGGWRWHVLAFQTPGAFALTRPIGEVIVVNRSNPALDRVDNAAKIGGTRTLSGVIAHERTHGLLRSRYGLLTDLRYPAWLREGYCDVVAGGGSLTDLAATALEARHVPHPALVYYHGRKRVAERLAANGGNVDALFSPQDQ